MHGPRVRTGYVSYRCAGTDGTDADDAELAAAGDCSPQRAL